jgi:hypothetical protein
LTSKRAEILSCSASNKYLGQAGTRAAGCRWLINKELTMASSVMCFMLGAVAPLATIGWMIVSTS